MKNIQDKFANSFGIDVKELPDSTKVVIDTYNFSTEEITGTERDALIIRIIDKIRRDKQKIASPERLKAWEDGWAENLQLYLASNGDQNSLIPRFIRAGEPIRWFGRYHISKDVKFELNYISVLRSYLIESYFSKVQSIYEFGAGTGFNLLHFGKIKPELNLIGTDFVDSSVRLMRAVSNQESIKLSAHLFDMLEPNRSELKIGPGAGIFTFGSLEQLGSNLSPILKYFYDQKPDVCVHIEPMIELYDTTLIEDYLASWFQAQRGYSSGLLGAIGELEKQGKARVMMKQRLNFGSMMMEGYNLLVWKPV
jgi:hypothetical protein